MCRIHNFKKYLPWDRQSSLHVAPAVDPKVGAAVGGEVFEERMVS